MPWFWTDHLAPLLASCRSEVPSSWVHNPIAIRVEMGANPLVIAAEILAEDAEDEPPSPRLLRAA